MAVAKKIAATNPVQLVERSVERQDRARATRSFAIIGRLYSVETDRGRIQFDQYKGPGIAQELDANGDETGSMLFVSELGDLPQLPEYSEEFCSACLQKCDVCDGNGKTGCIFAGCGGRGLVQNGEEECPDCVKVDGHFNPACGTCKGRGAVAKWSKCPSCKGSSKMKCDACRGIGKRPSGRPKKWTATPGSENQFCPSCRGSQRAGKWKPQDLTKMVAGKIGNYLVIGPVARLVIAPSTPDRQADRFSARWNAGDGKAATGSFLRLTYSADEQVMILLPLIRHAGQPMIGYFFATV